MSIFDNKINKSVAEAVMKVMQQEELKGNQHRIDANKNGKVDAHDFKLLRAGKKPDMKKEEVEQLDEVGDTPAGRKALGSYVMKALHDKERQKGVRKATSRLYKDNYYGKKTNEEFEQLQEYESKGGVFRHTAKLEKGAEYGASDYSKGGEEEKEAKKMMSSPKRAQKGYGARQNYVRGTSTGEKKKVNESLSFTEMLELYNEHGIKVLAPIEKEELNIDGTTIEVIDGDKINGFVETTVEEEATNDQFTKEFEDQRASFEGKKPQPKVAAGKTVGVKTMPEEVEQIDEAIPKSTNHALVHSSSKKIIAKGNKAEMMKKMKELNAKEKNSHHLGMTNRGKVGDTFGEEVELDERTLTAAETAKKEKIVKSMKKGLAGFKQRYGERAKEVMYATATKQAKKD